ncbi:hypothetical protein OE88DRAFT_1643143 [Heliocybe sulcata]|uniref:Uncharacterized protein n=1 Tax=Heliocybe sulcata TaxID=5364 RepID=A0A5C3NBK5_9AGAM|nr:hypothetical protein OE88DRAFT_1643143 [Heliocybe sulcata]
MVFVIKRRGNSFVRSTPVTDPLIVGTAQLDARARCLARAGFAPPAAIFVLGPGLARDKKEAMKVILSVLIHKLTTAKLESKDTLKRLVIWGDLDEEAHERLTYHLTLFCVVHHIEFAWHGKFVPWVAPPLARPSAMEERLERKMLYLRRLPSDL